MTKEELEVTKVAADAVMKPFAVLCERLFGGSVDEIGGMWQDSLRVRRDIRQLKLMKKLQRGLEDAAFEPQQIPDKIWMPLLQAASLEEDDELQSLFAALLTNAADPKKPNPVHPSYLEIIRQLSSVDAMFLMDAHKEADGIDVSMTEVTLVRNFERVAPNTSHDDFLFTLDNVVRLGLLEKTSESGERGAYSGLDPSMGNRNYANLYGPFDSAGRTIIRYRLTTLARAFIKACSPPKKSQTPSS